MPSCFHFGIKIWPKRFQDAPKSAQGTDQEPPEKRPIEILEPTWAQMFWGSEQFLHRIKDLSDVDGILFPFRRENLTKRLPRCSRVGPRHSPRAAREAPKRKFGANSGSNGVQSKYAPWAYFEFDVSLKLMSKRFWTKCIWEKNHPVEQNLWKTHVVLVSPRFTSFLRKEGSAAVAEASKLVLKPKMISVIGSSKGFQTHV